MAELVSDASTLASVTPMMRQYLDIKEKYPDHILMYRLGDFFEMFFSDAILVSRELELTLTGRDCGNDKRAAMCGVPFHKADVYIGKLVERGHKVAVCEQTEDPAEAKGLVRREIVRVVTPGTVTDGSLLSEAQNNYLASIFCTEHAIGLGFADVSTGQISVTLLEGEDAFARLAYELAVYSPREAIMNVSAESCRAAADFLASCGAYLTDSRSDLFDELSARMAVAAHFSDDGEKLTHTATLCAVGALLAYIAETQKCGTAFVKDLNVYTDGQAMEIDLSTRRNLELTEAMRTKEKKGSLLWVLDKTRTSMGARMLRAWLVRPLLNPVMISTRQTAIQDFFDNFMRRAELRALLSDVLDLERLTAKAVYGTANAKDLAGILQSISILPALAEELAPFSAPRLCELRDGADQLLDIAELLRSALAENPPFSLRDGGIIREGYDPDVDYLRSVMQNGKGWIEEIEARERESTGIKNLRIHHNKVFGYYIEVTRSQIELVPDRYIRKQTLANCERYITEELKDMEATVLGAADKLNALEYALFSKLREQVAEAATRIQEAAARIAEIDVYLSLAEVAFKNNYVCPEVDLSDKFEVTDGRHPVVERCLADHYFVPNDTKMDTDKNRLLLITGPNMAGKSTYMRQVALMAVMAQMGSFVPARAARIGIVDKLFTRVGASDDLASGQSTFMLEMNEVANILKKATSRSLIVYDEVGRGTSTYDGMSIARAVAEYTLSKKIGARTLFATHYHELTVLEDEFTGVVNYNVAAKKQKDTIIFLRKIVRGATDDSYGIEVAKLAGLPNEVIKRAKEVLAGVEATARALQSAPGEEQRPNEQNDNISFEDCMREQVVEELKKVDLNTLSPYEAMSCLFDLQKRLK